ncbi:MAG: hypothetical protein AAF804_05190, partial [Bacteroidota bacterium]
LMLLVKRPHGGLVSRFGLFDGMLGWIAQRIWDSILSHVPKPRFWLPGEINFPGNLKWIYGLLVQASRDMAHGPVQGLFHQRR